MNQSKRQQIRACTFELEVTQGTGSIKFPCLCYVEWKTSNGKDSIKSPNRVKLLQGKLAFNQKLTLTTHMVYDLSTQAYAKKQSVVILNLLSNSRPNEPKLVGRVSIQLSSVASATSFQELKQYPLEFCSVDATLTFKVTFVDYVQTNLGLIDLERSQYSEIEPALSQKYAGKQDTKSESGARGISSISMRSVSNQLNKDKNLTKASESPFQDRMNRIRADNQHLLNIKPPEGYASRFKRELETGQEAKDNNLNNREEKTRQYTKGLNNDLSVPILTKNSDEFDSNKISEKTIPNPGKSEKDILIHDSPFKNSSSLIKDSNLQQQNQFYSIKNQQFPSEKAIESRIVEKYQQQISSLKSSIESLRVENQGLALQLSGKNDELASLKVEHSIEKQKSAELNRQIVIKSQELESLQQLNYPILLEQLNKSIQQKDREIETLIAATFEAENTFQNKSEAFQTRIASLEDQIRSLEQFKYQKQKESPKLQSSPESSKQQLNSIIDDLTYRLQLERKNHENTKIELNQFQEWYKEIQQQSQKLIVQNEELKSLRMQDQANTEKLQGIIDQLHHQKQSDQQIHLLLSQKQTTVAALTEQLNQSKNKLFELNQTLQNQMINQQKLQQQLRGARKQVDQLQSKYVQQESKLHIMEGKFKQASKQLDQNKKEMLANASSTQQRCEELEDTQKKMSDLIKRIKQKQEHSLKMQREAQQLESKLKLSQSNCEKIKERTKALQTDKNTDQQKIKALQKQVRLLKSKTERDQEQLNRQINKLKQNLQNQNNKKRELNNMLSQAESKSKSNDSSKVRELEKKVKTYAQKELLLKEQLSLLEHQSNKIADLIQQKQQNEEKYSQAIVILNQDNVNLKAKVGQLENLCELLNERNQGLQAQIQLLNAYQPNESEQNEIAELNKKLIDKNKQLLHQIEEKNLFIAELQKTEGEMKGKEVEQLLSTSRMQKERQQYEEKYQQIVEENEKLYKEFQKLNNKYRDEIIENNKSNQQKIQSLETKVEQLYIKLTEKDVKYAELQIKSKEDLEKLQQTIHEKEYQLEYYPNQIRQLNNNIQMINDQLTEKDFQLQLAEEKIKQLFETVTNLSVKKQDAPPVIVPNNQALEEQVNHYKSKAEFYQAEIERLHEKEFIQEKELITISQEIAKLKENGDEEAKHIVYLEGQLKNFRDRQTQYIQQIDSLQANQNLFKGRYSRLEKDKNELNLEIDRLSAEIEVLKQKRDNNQQGTPINKFKESPSPVKPAVDISDIVGEINTILTRRKQEQELENALRLVIDNNTRQEQQFQRWSRERGLIQEKAKLASKQLQKIKANIMKTANRSIAQKTQLTNLLKPAETIVNDLIHLSQHLIELDPYEEQEEQFQNQNQSSQSK